MPACVCVCEPPAAAAAEVAAASIDWAWDCLQKTKPSKGTSLHTT